MTNELVLPATSAIFDSEPPTTITNTITATINKEATQLIVKALEIMDADVGISMMRIAFPTEALLAAGEEQYGKHRIKLIITPEIKNIVTTYIDVYKIGAMMLGFETTTNDEDFITYTASLKTDQDMLYYIANH